MNPRLEMLVIYAAFLLMLALMVAGLLVFLPLLAFAWAFYGDRLDPYQTAMRPKEEKQ